MLDDSDVNYAAIYDGLMQAARSRKPAGYVERHHVLPKCLGGNNRSENLVELTAREHYLAHMLLARMNPGKPGLSYAVVMMGAVAGRTGSRSYERVRAVAVAHMSASKKGVPRPRHVIEAMVAGTRRHPRSEETKAKLSAVGMGRVVSAETRLRISEALVGRAHSEESRQKQSEARRGKPIPSLIGNRSRTGMKNSPEMRRRISIANTGRRLSAASKQSIAVAQARLPAEVIRSIRAEYAERSLSQDKLAKKYGIGQSHVSRIVLGQTYYWIK